MMTQQFLLIDADDTLWENNIYFERTFDEFVAFLDHSSLTAPQVRCVLDEIEEANNRVHGYGTLNFARNLQQCYQRLAERAVQPRDLDAVMALAKRILECPMEVIGGVPETLAYLAARHQLTIFTKGHQEEQKLKIDRSGLARFFTHAAIVKEKDAPAYRRLVEEQGFEPRRTWMIGNSPKSDINPALEAGLNAAFVPHAHTWRLEHQEIKTGPGQLLLLEQFEDLQKHF